MLGGNLAQTLWSINYTSKVLAYENTSKCAKDRFKRPFFIALSVIEKKTANNLKMYHVERVE